MCMGPLYVLLAEVSVQVPCPFFNWVVCLPGVESCEFFIYIGDQTLVRGIIGKNIFPYGCSLFVLLIFSLAIRSFKKKNQVTECFMRLLAKDQVEHSKFIGLNKLMRKILLE